MFLKKLCIKNFRIFKDFELTLNPGMNLIVGENNSGKTNSKLANSIIKAMKSLDILIEATESASNLAVFLMEESMKIIKKVSKLKNEIIRLEASPKISLFFGLNPETDQPVYTKKTDKKGSFKEEITGVLSDKHEIRVLTGQMSKICSIKPPEP